MKTPVLILRGKHRGRTGYIHGGLWDRPPWVRDAVVHFFNGASSRIHLGDLTLDENAAQLWLPFDQDDT
jgi:hypothetical protein